MGENLEPESVPSPEACRSGLSASSSLAVDLSVSGADVASGQCAEWTNERHRSYLESLEASFVKQLHGSLGLLGRHSQESTQMTNSSHKVLARTRLPSEQFTVLRNGCWQRISFQRNQPLSNKIVDSNVSIDSPWISRFRPAGKHQMSKSNDFREPINEGSQSARNSTFYVALATNSEKRHSCHEDLVGNSTAEVSDQNFVDDDRVKESRSCTSKAKRLKTNAVDSSSNDQIVPNGNKFCS